MAQYDKLEMTTQALSVFMQEILEQAAAIRAYTNVFVDVQCDNEFLKRAHDAIWRELLSEIARVFDKSKTCGDENCTFSWLQEICLEEPYLKLFPDAEKDSVLQSLDEICKYYNKHPIKIARNKQLSHHDVKQLFEGECIEISLDEIENLIVNTTLVLGKIISRFYLDLVDVTFPNYDMLVNLFENELRKLLFIHENPLD